MIVKDLAPGLPDLSYANGGFVTPYQAQKNDQNPWSNLTGISPDLQQVGQTIKGMTRNPYNWDLEAVRIIEESDSAMVQLAFSAGDYSALPYFEQSGWVRLLRRAPRTYLDLPQVFNRSDLSSPQDSSYRKTRFEHPSEASVRLRGEKYADGQGMGRFQPKDAIGFPKVTLYLADLNATPFYLYERNTNSVAPQEEDPTRFVGVLNFQSNLEMYREKSRGFADDVRIVAQRTAALIEQRATINKELRTLKKLSSLLQIKGPTSDQKFYLKALEILQDAPSGLEPEQPPSDN